jgi:hypothetical protein
MPYMPMTPLGAYQGLAVVDLVNFDHLSYDYFIIIIIVPLSHYVGSAQPISSAILFYYSSSPCSLLLFSCHPSHSPSIFS